MTSRTSLNRLLLKPSARMFSNSVLKINAQVVTVFQWNSICTSGTVWVKKWFKASTIQLSLSDAQKKS